MTPKNILFVLGTRPEAIKCAPVILACRKDRNLHTEVLVTSQHRELQDDVLKQFGIVPDYDFDLMGKKSNLNRLVRDAWVKLGKHFEKNATDLVLVQGDTTTAMIAALSAQYSKVPAAHIEAGLRTHDKAQPFPEEINRTLISHLADLHFAPTHESKQNLLREGIAPEKIQVVGNPGIDALKYMIKNLEPELEEQIRQQIPRNHRLVLVTCHRRENWGKNLENVCAAIKQLCDLYEDVTVFFLLHPNPTVKKAVMKHLMGHRSIQLIPAVNYQEMAALLKASFLILTDSGGIQEEAPSVGKPVLVLRNTTERPEMIAKNSGILVGTDPARVVSSAKQFLDNSMYHSYYKNFSKHNNIYGDGKTSVRICKAIKAFFGLTTPPVEFNP